MTDDATKQLKSVGLTVAIIGAVLTLGVITLPPPVPPKTITLAWDKNTAEAITEVWSTTNLVDWELRTNVTGSNVTLAADKPQEFFKVRNRVGNQVSDWSRK